MSVQTASPNSTAAAHDRDSACTRCPCYAASPPTHQALASRGATLFMLCRNQQRGQEAVQAVREQTGNKDVQLAV